MATRLCTRLGMGCRRSSQLSGDHKWKHRPPRSGNSLIAAGALIGLLGPPLMELGYDQPNIGAKEMALIAGGASLVVGGVGLLAWGALRHRHFQRWHAEHNFSLKPIVSRTSQWTPVFGVRLAL